MFDAFMKNPIWINYVIITITGAISFFGILGMFLKNEWRRPAWETACSLIILAGVAALTVLDIDYKDLMNIIRGI